jgi:hypothetical protein
VRHRRRTGPPCNARRRSLGEREGSARVNFEDASRSRTGMWRTLFNRQGTFPSPLAWRSHAIHPTARFARAFSDVLGRAFRSSTSLGAPLHATAIRWDALDVALCRRAAAVVDVVRASSGFRARCSGARLRARAFRRRPWSQRGWELSPDKDRLAPVGHVSGGHRCVVRCAFLSARTKQNEHRDDEAPHGGDRRMTWTNPSSVTFPRHCALRRIAR